MVQIRIQKDESLDKAIARFRRACSKEGLVTELKKRSFYEKPSEKRRRLMVRKNRKGRGRE